MWVAAIILGCISFLMFCCCRVAKDEDEHYDQ